MAEKPIGIFDSGVGGLSIVLAIKKLLPKEHFIYLADQNNCPYGNKSKKEIRDFTFKISQFLIFKGCKLIIVACNTSTISAINYLRHVFPETPFIGVNPGVKPAAQTTQTKHIVVLSTPITKDSVALKELISRYAKRLIIYNLSCPQAVLLVEQGITQGLTVNNVLKQCLRPALKDRLIDTVTLGCTHYFFLKKAIIELFGEGINIIEPSLAIAKRAKQILKDDKLTATCRGKNLFFTTGQPINFDVVAVKLLRFKVKSAKVII